MGCPIAAYDAYGRLDGAFNNAGIPEFASPLHQITAQGWRRINGINLDGVFHCLKHEIAAMLPTGGGSIVNVSSVAGLGGQTGMASYVASKHGVLGLTRAATLDYAGQGIRVNAICPGSILTPLAERAIAQWPEKSAEVLDLTPMARWGAPLEIAYAAAWLLSDASTYVSGVSLAIDGGMTAGWYRR